MSRPPCIRGLKQFRGGCPQRSWNGHDGCPAWIDRDIPDRDNPPKVIAANMCVDIYLSRLQWDTNAFLQGIQASIESFRNNMTEVDEEGKKHPKTSRGMGYLIGLIEEEMKAREIIYAHEARKKLE
jgi:hypothetical protein